MNNQSYKSINITSSQLVHTGFGRLRGVFVSSASGSPTLKFVDGVDENDDVIDAADSTLTSSGAFVPAKHASTILTSNGTNVTDVVQATQTLTSSGAFVPGTHATSEIVTGGASVAAEYAQNTLTSTGAISDGEIVTLDAIVYRFKTTPVSSYDVNLGANTAAALDNLKLAINATGVGDGTDYFTGTIVHPTQFASTNTDTTQVLVAKTIGTGSNAEATTTDGANLAWEDTTLGGGTGASVTGVVTTNSTITIASTVYVSTLSLAESFGLPAVTEQVLWVTSEAVFLDNFKSAINNTGTEGTDYGTGTVAQPDVVATTNTDTVQTIIARVPGTTPNALATTETMANYAWADTTLGGGTGNSDPGVTTGAAQLAIGGRTYTFVDALSETSGATAIVDQILYGGSEAVALDNMKVAINNGATEGTNYSTGTVVSATVTATTNTDTTQIVQAIAIGTAGNSITSTENMANTAWGAGNLAGGLDDGEVAVMGSVTYRFMSTTTQAFDVKIGASAAATLDNLKVAVNATGTGDGSDYHAGTTAHPDVIATANAATTQAMVARVVGVAINSGATTTTAATLSWEDTTFGGGGGSSVAGVVDTAAQFAINSRTYTFVNELSETSGATAVVDQILYGGSEAVALDNMKVAINAGATAGTNYSTGTVVNADVTADTNTNTTQVITAIVAGTIGNAITTTENMANTAWTSTVLTGGLEVNVMMVDTFTPVAATFYDFANANFDTGMYVTVGGTLECMVMYD